MFDPGERHPYFGSIVIEVLQNAPFHFNGIFGIPDGRVGLAAGRPRRPGNIQHPVAPGTAKPNRPGTAAMFPSITPSARRPPPAPRQHSTPGRPRRLGNIQHPAAPGTPGNQTRLPLSKAQ